MRKNKFIDVFLVFALLFTSHMARVSADALPNQRPIREWFENQSVATAVANSLDLDIDAIISLEELENINSFDVRQQDITGITSLTELALLSNLKFINLLGQDITSFEGVELFPQLTDLLVIDNPIQSLEHVQKAPQLDTLHLGNLHHNRVDFSDNINVLEPLSHMLMLKDLNLHSTGLTNAHLEAIDDTPLTTIETLRLNDNNIQAFSNVARIFPNTFVLEIKNNALSSLEDVEQMTNLNILNVENTHVLPANNQIIDYSSITLFDDVVNTKTLESFWAHANNLMLVPQFDEIKGVYFFDVSAVKPLNLGYLRYDLEEERTENQAEFNETLLRVEYPSIEAVHVAMDRSSLPKPAFPWMSSRRDLTHMFSIHLHNQETSNFGELFFFPAESKVVTQYLDIDTQEVLSEPHIQTRIVLDHFDSEVLAIEGYDFVSTDGNKTGVHAEEDTYVTHYYRQTPVKGSITVHYVDEAGNSLTDSVTLSGNIGDVVTLDVKEFEGMTFTQNVAEVAMIEDGLELTLIYKTDKHPVAPVNPADPDEGVKGVKKPKDPVNEGLPQTGVSNTIEFVGMGLIFIGMYISIKGNRKRNFEA